MFWYESKNTQLAGILQKVDIFISFKNLTRGNCKNTDQYTQ